VIKEALQYVVDLGGQKIQQAHGIAYVRNGNGTLEKLASPALLAKPLEFHSLSGLVEYVSSNHDGVPDGLALVVDGPEKVRLIGKLTADFRQREEVASAEPYLSKPFPFGSYLDLETFVTSLQTSFVADETTAAVLKIVGNVSGEAVQTVADDGVSQSVTARTGIAKVANVTMPNPVSLAPYRTFPGVLQPYSKYVLRLQRREGELPKAALFEVGDCQWKHTAVDAIAAKLNELLDTAGVKLPVLA
jgi:hypothetical protein